MSITRVIFTSIVALCAAGATQAATITYDESVDGDAGKFDVSPVDLGTLAVGDTYRISGAASLSGPFNDGYDYFTFTATSDFSIDLTQYAPGAGTTTSGFRIYDTSNNRLGGFNYGAPTNNIFSTLNLGAGTYTFGMTEFGATTPSSYTFELSLDLAPVPLPASGMLLLAGLGGFAALRRR